MSPEILPSDVQTVLIVLGLYAAIVISPGPNFALISRLALFVRRTSAYGATFGFAVSATFYAILAMTGLSVVLEQFGWLARAIQIGGGLYLIYLGIGAWRQAAHPGNDPGHAGSRLMQGFRAGFLVDMANPKAIAFFISLYAAAVPHDTALWARLVILAGGFALELGWYGLVATLLARPAARTLYRRMGKWLERATGTILIAFGVRLLTEH